MNVIDLPTTWAGWLDLAVSVITGGVQSLLSSPTGTSVTFGLLVAMAGFLTVMRKPWALGGALLLIVAFVVSTLTVPLALTVMLTVVVVLAAALCGSLGTPEDSPILTEADRQAAR